MWRAISLARRAQEFGHRPFGSLIVSPRGEILAGEYGSELDHDSTRHSEVLAIQQAERLRRGLLHDCTLFQTFEPCTYCAGAILHAKLSRVVIGAMRADLPQLFRQKKYTSTMLFMDTTTPPEVVVGVLREECVALFDIEVVINTGVPVSTPVVDLSQRQPFFPEHS